MQQPPQMIPMMPSFPSTSITTEQIQKYLDENKKLILAILDNQNLGKLAECAQYQAQLQKNLMYLAAIADAQPQSPAIPSQMAPHPAMQQGGYYMQHPQAAAMAQQSGMFSPKMQMQMQMQMQFNSPHGIQDPQQLHQQHQQAMQGQMGMRPMGSNNGMHPMHHGDSVMGAGGSSKQDASEAGTEGQGGSAAGYGSGDGVEGK